LPLAWLLVAARAPVRATCALAALLVVANLASWLPMARDRRAVDEARAFAAQLRTGDLVISPGHGWDESIPLYADGVVPFPLVFHAAARGGMAGLAADLDAALAAARARHARVLTARIHDHDDPSGTLGWKDLAPLGIDRQAIDALLRSRGVDASRP
jgi:hypothetical protein